MLRKQLTTMAKKKNANNKYHHNDTDEATHWPSMTLTTSAAAEAHLALISLRRPNLTSGRAPFSHPRHYRPPQAPWPGREESCKTRRGSAARCRVRYVRRVKKMIRRFNGWAAISPSSATAGAITEMDERRRRGCENAAFSTRNNESAEIRKCCFALTQCHERITLWKIQRKN